MPNVRIAYPPDGASFAIDPGAAGEQAITIKVDVPPAIQEVRLLIDGQPRVLRAPFRISLGHGARRSPGASGGRWRSG